MNHKVEKGKQYIMLMSTKSANWDAESGDIVQAIEAQGAKIVDVILVNAQEATIELIECSKIEGKDMFDYKLINNNE